MCALWVWPASLSSSSRSKHPQYLWIKCYEWLKLPKIVCEIQIRRSESSGHAADRTSRIARSWGSVERSCWRGSVLTTRELANTFESSSSTILHGLRDIGKVNKRGRWLPHKLTENNKNQRSTTCSCLLSQAKRSGFMDQ